MMNGSDENSETVIAERNERAKKLYRYISDIARAVNDATTPCKNISELFNTRIEIQRQKLRDNCVKLLFLDPLNYGKKALELLWRKVYYDTVSAAKKLRECEQEYDNYLFTHIISGIGQFHHLISRIQSEVKLWLKELDYTPLYNDEETEVIGEVSNDLEQCGRFSVYSCLIYLGDLSRYQAEIFHTFDPSIAARYYQQAAQIDLSSGMPYNQLANLYMDKNHNLTSACYYIQCLSSVTPFEGALGNLTKLFEKNAQLAESISGWNHIQSQPEHIQGTISKFLSLIEIWYFGKVHADIPQRCNVIAQDLRIAMDLHKLTSTEDINKNYDEYMQSTEEESINPSYLNDNIIHEMVQICIFTVAKISETDETQAFAAKAFSLALASQLLHKLLQQLQSYGLKNPASKYRRRYSSAVESDHDEAEEPVEPVKGFITNKTPNVNGLSKNKKLTFEENDDDDVIIVEEDVEKDKQISNEDENKSTSNGKKSSAKRRRRRRVGSSGSSDMSDESESSGVDSDGTDEDNDDEQSNSSYQSNSNSDISDAECSDTEIPDKQLANGDAKEHENNNIDTKEINPKIDIKENNKGMTNGQHDKTTTSNNNKVELDAMKIQNFLKGANFLPSLKLIQDWILKEKDLLLSCGESGESLFQCVVDLLNIMEFNFTLKHKGEEHESCNILEYARCLAKSLEIEYRTIPLPEDVNLRGTNVCKYDMHAAEWNILKQYKPSIYEENVIRILNFIDFGQQIANIVPKIRFNRTMQVYYLKKSPGPKSSHKIIHKRTKEWQNSKNPQVQGEGPESGLLHRLGRLWLTARVKELELERCGRVSPTLLAVDAAALTLQLKRVKQLIKTRNFIILIPTVVLQELDDLKRDQIEARDAIRWLEAQLQSGSRYLKAQRPGQSKSLPLLKYPKKAPTQVHNFIKILEFCYHFVADEKPQDTDKAASMLVLLTGSDRSSVDDYKECSLTGAAQSAGISLEQVTTFYTKWRQAIQKNGKKR